LALFQDIGDVLTAEGLQDQSILDGASDRIGSVDFAESENLAQVMPRVQAPLLEFLVIALGGWRPQEEAPE
jgi:hypothetical protein